jgi:hypothetical protein
MISQELIDFLCLVEVLRNKKSNLTLPPSGILTYMAIIKQPSNSLSMGFFPHLNPFGL